MHLQSNKIDTMNLPISNERTRKEGYLYLLRCRLPYEMTHRKQWALAGDSLCFYTCFHGVSITACDHSRLATFEQAMQALSIHGKSRLSFALTEESPLAAVSYSSSAGMMAAATTLGTPLAPITIYSETSHFGGEVIHIIQRPAWLEKCKISQIGGADFEILIKNNMIGLSGRPAPLK